MKKLFTANKYLPVALAVAAFTAATAAPAFAQSSGAWSAGISTRNARPYVTAATAAPAFAQSSGAAPLVHKQATQLSGYNSYARVPNYSATGPSRLGRPNPFGLNEWFQR